jgi:hypothetical protein
MDPLHNIILSLTPNEKRYFRIFAATFKNSSQVIKLFEKLSKMAVYDEPVLVKKTGVKNLVSTKISLRKLLFKAMRNYYEGVDIHQQLRDDIRNIEFLIRKGLKDEAAKEMRRAIKIAEKAEAYNVLSELLVYSATPEKPVKPDEILSHFDSALAHLGETVEKQFEIQQAELLRLKIVYLIHRGSYEAPDELSGQVNETSLKMEEIAAGAKSNYARICLLVGAAAAHSNEERCSDLYEQVYQLYKQDPQNMHKHPNLYFVFLLNYCSFTVNRKPTKLSEKLFVDLETAFVTFKNYFKYYPDKLAHFRNIVTCNKLTYNQKTGKWQNLAALTNEVQKSLLAKAFKKQLLSSLMVGTLINCLFDAKKYSEAIDWVQTYFSLPSAKIMKPLMLSIRFYECMCFYLTGNYDLSEGKSKNLANTMIEQEFNDEYYKLICTLLRRLNYWNIADKKSRDEIEALRKKFEKLRAEGDSHYVMFSGFLQPDLVLGHINSFNRQNHKKMN